MHIKTTSYQTEVTTLRRNLHKQLPAEALAVFDADAERLQDTHITLLKCTEGDTAYDFSLPNAVGTPKRLSELLADQKVVLVFYRGTWCPYCNLQLRHYQTELATIHALGAQLVAVSPQTADASLDIKERNELQFEALSDQGSVVAQQYTTVFKNDDAPVMAMKALGFDFDAHYSDASRLLPVPAVFIIEQDATISFAASLGGDYRNRVDVSTIITHLKKA